jgi:hypothetical protein
MHWIWNHAVTPNPEIGNSPLYLLHNSVITVHGTWFKPSGRVVCLLTYSETYLEMHKSRIMGTLNPLWLTVDL